MREHARFDKRSSPIVDVREGSGEWVQTNEQLVLDEMDLRWLERLRTIDWCSPSRAGRTSTGP